MMTKLPRWSSKAWLWAAQALKGQLARASAIPVNHGL